MKQKLIALSVVLVLAGGVSALADDDDHDRALEALRRGEVLSLRAILDRAAADQPGDLIEAELEHEHGRPLYELKLLTPEGRVLKLKYDARTGERISPGQDHRE
ncbi:PepSY domain-containing protein [Novispirillum sp. DQ9]|uniref:PepSY domain-containing protein n=1 Tax=Novispirillum sp. DQ9 TaxID=3398612 RepID=UPI003C7A0589